ncbi:MAG: tRNA lysidine(34) synthetase TilS [Eudoraea sp.]|nr:tRNA lysidine(34) synthetase TilS [Eudoraea sp.]
MLKKFKEQLEGKFPELLKKPFLLACSGGADSVVLAHLCKQIGLEFAIAHAHFGLRGEESDQDEVFVNNLSKKYNLKYFVKHFKTEEYATESKVSIQVAARELRYAWFEEIRQAENLSYCVTAHHADDNLETFLINLSRGTGIRGLIGIPEKTAVLIRPMLNFTRKEILEYAGEYQLIWREDSSNLEKKYLRNKIRHDVIPDLKSLHPGFMDNFKQTQGFLRESNKILHNHLHAVKETCFRKEEGWVKIELEPLRKLSPIRAYLHGLLGSYGFKEWADVESLLTAIPGKQVLSDTHRLVKARNYLILQEIPEEKNEVYSFQLTTGSIREPLRLLVEEVDAMGTQSEKVLYADKETLKDGITIRKWKKGDYFYPFGMRGQRKLLSKYFKDEKLDLNAKENQWLLCSNQDVVWVIGRRSDERFKVTQKTKKIIKISLLT